ncbi:hypothetical protein BLNAU_10732 [Blattamonas nauphoetae]|uniref:Uncharacterized protein n=1 Tax=Blattamonas nauphoetae TaxID=2049346 RepID=A0ABQ9XT23_9EUKA|nr:hypothetical protein BLNAU_10732 [Blattamonas nauphoetae]
MECSPFVVCWMGETDWSSITVTESSHVSSCSPSLLPLVGICDDSIRSGKTASHDQLDRNDNQDKTDGWTPSVSITGSSIEFGDGDLILGTGPLIGSLDRIGNEEKKESVSTSLVGCVLVNMTSRTKLEGSKVGSWFVQSIVGSIVSSCSNHLYGTSIRSLNGGGSLLSLNSSFLSCLTTENFENKPFKKQTFLDDEYDLHSFKLCTYKNCMAMSTTGGAISSIEMLFTDVHIESCSFQSCSAYYSGGAIYIDFAQGSKRSSLTLKSSFFTFCSSERYDGTLEVNCPDKSTVSECVFMNSEATAYGGAFSFHIWNPASTGGVVSNCLFQNCTQTEDWGDGGGAMFLSECTSVRLSSLLFKDCHAERGTGHAIIFWSQSYMIPSLSSTAISNCVSVSAHSTNLIYVGGPYSYAVDSLISTSPPQIALTALTAEVTGSTADVQVTLDQEISGTLLVVVSNVGGTRKEVSGGIPNIGRVLEFTISSSSIGSCSVSIGETGLLQTPLSDYSIVSAFFSGHNISFTNSPIFGKPKIPSLTSASSSLDASHTEATVRFEGRDFEEGKYDVTLNDGSLSNVQFSKDVDGKWIGLKELGVIGADSDWTEGGTYTVTEVKSVSKPTQSIKIDDPVSFTIPTVARLSEIKVSELDASTKGKVTLSFSSVELEKGVEYTLTLVGQDSAKETLTRTMNTTSSGEIEELEEVLYPFKTDPAEQMKFGVLYKVTSLKATGRSNSVQFGLVGVQMPVEPVRLTKIEVDDETETSVKLVVTGSGFVVRETYTVEVSGVLTGSESSNTHTRTFTVVASGTTSASSSPLVLSSSDPTSLQFGQTYAVTKIEDATKEGIVVGTPSFPTPSLTPHITSASSSLDASHTEATVRFEGRDFEEGKYDVTLNDGSLSNVQFSKDVDGKWIGLKELGVIGADSDWTEGGTYTVTEVKSVSKPTQSIKIDDPVSFTIPTVARLSEIKVSELDASTKGKVTLSFSSVELEKGVEYTLTLVGQDSAKETLTRTMNTTSSGEIEELEEVLYPFKTDPAEQMKFGVLYKVTSLKATGRSNSVQFGLVGVQMPVEPVRLTKIEVDDETETSVKLVVTGSGFVVRETYTVEVSGVLTGSESSNTHTRTFTVVASGTTSASSSPLVLSSSDPTSLQFGQTYAVTKIEDATKEGIVVGTPSFPTPSLTPHITSASSSLDASRDPKIQIVHLIYFIMFYSTFCHS